LYVYHALALYLVSLATSKLGFHPATLKGQFKKAA
jgi:hypothetical protein